MFMPNEARNYPFTVIPNEVRNLDRHQDKISPKLSHFVRDKARNDKTGGGGVVQIGGGRLEGDIGGM